MNAVERYSFEYNLKCLGIQNSSAWNYMLNVEHIYVCILDGISIHGLNFMVAHAREGTCVFDEKQS